jgi:hypothetical protein
MQVIRDFGGDNSNAVKPIHNQYPDKKSKLDQETYFSVPKDKNDFTLGGTSRHDDSIVNSMD